MTGVLIIGVDPSVVDPDDPATPSDVTPETIAEGIQDALADMRSRGWRAEHCAILPDGSAEETIAACLRRTAWDVVVIGGGVRVPPRFLLLFERVIAAVRNGAPRAAIAFNTSPTDSSAAALRWLDDRGRTRAVSRAPDAA